jgi:hypothetical protein
VLARVRAQALGAQLDRDEGALRMALALGEGAAGLRAEVHEAGRVALRGLF